MTNYETQFQLNKFVDKHYENISYQKLKCTSRTPEIMDSDLDIETSKQTTQHVGLPLLGLLFRRSYQNHPANAFLDGTKKNMIIELGNISR